MSYATWARLTVKSTNVRDPAALNSKPAVTLAEIESWIGEHIKPKTA